MNTGIQDVASLAWKLAAVGRGADNRLLDSYEEERTGVGEALLEFTERGLQMMTISKPSSGGRCRKSFKKDGRSLPHTLSSSGNLRLGSVDYSSRRFHTIRSVLPWQKSGSNALFIDIPLGLIAIDLSLER